jgi:hypothetical protein
MAPEATHSSKAAMHLLVSTVDVGPRVRCCKCTTRQCLCTHGCIATHVHGEIQMSVLRHAASTHDCAADDQGEDAPCGAHCHDRAYTKVNIAAARVQGESVHESPASVSGSTAATAAVRSTHGEGDEQCMPASSTLQRPAHQHCDKLQALSTSSSGPGNSNLASSVWRSYSGNATSDGQSMCNSEAEDIDVDFSAPAPGPTRCVLPGFRSTQL